MSYLTLSEAAEYASHKTGLQIEPAAMLRAGVHGVLLITAPFSSLMRNLTAGQNDEVLGLLVVPPKHLLEIETDGQAKIIGAISLDGKTGYSPQVTRTRDQLRVLVSELDRFMPYLVTSTTQQQAPATTLFDSGLSVREFKTHLLNVPDLLEWAKSKRLHLRTTPPLDGYEFVHIETLLCAIERHAMSLTHEQARDIVANDPALQARMFAGLGVERGEFDNYVKESPAWLVQADAHSQWRKLFAAAIQAGELALLDFGSKLPIDTAPEQNTATPAPLVDSTSNAPVEGITTAQVAAIFDGLPFTAENWPKRLSDTKWVKPAQVALGAVGGATSLWSPATLARLIHSRKQGAEKQKTLETLNRKFKNNPVLQPWRTDWNEHYEMFNDAVEKH